MVSPDSNCARQVTFAMMMNVVGGINTLSDFPGGGCLMGEMHDQSDAQLLRDYAEHGAEAAFAEIVARHTDLVYSAALRQVYSPDLARDVTQSVFTDLARKARTVSANLSPEASLVGWLYRGTRFAARDLYRNETRRTQRERQAMEQLHLRARNPARLGTTPPRPRRRHVRTR